MKKKFTIAILLIASFVNIQKNSAQGFTGPFDPVNWNVIQGSPLDQVTSWDSSQLNFQVDQQLIFFGPSSNSPFDCGQNLSFDWSTTGFFNPSDFIMEIHVGGSVYNLTTFPPGHFGPVIISSSDPVAFFFVQTNWLAPPGQFTIDHFTISSTDSIAPIALMPSDTTLVADPGECCIPFNYLQGPSSVYYQHNDNAFSSFTYLTNDGTSFISENLLLWPDDNMVMTGVSVLEKVCYPFPTSIELSLYQEGQPVPLIYDEVIDSSDYEMVLDQVTPGGDSLYMFTLHIPDIVIEGIGSYLRIGIQGNGAGCFQWVTDDQPENDLQCYGYPGSLDVSDWNFDVLYSQEPIIKVEYKSLVNLFTDSMCGIHSVQMVEGLFPGACFPVGTTHNVFVGTDHAGNQTTASFDVTVMGNLPPVPQLDSLPIVVGLCETFITTAPTAVNACNSNTYTGTTTDPLQYTDAGIYTVHWTYTDDNGNTSTQEQTVLVAVEECVGIEEQNHSFLQIFPNPSNGVFTISTDLSAENSTIEIINTTGQKEYSGSLLSSHQTFELDDLDRGVYHLVIMNGPILLTKSIIIQ